MLQMPASLYILLITAEQYMANRHSPSGSNRALLTLTFETMEMLSSVEASDRTFHMRQRLQAAYATG